LPGVGWTHKQELSSQSGN